MSTTKTTTAPANQSDLTSVPGVRPSLGDGDDAPWIATVMWVTVLAATVPLVVALVRALLNDWIPIGDNAYFTVRSRDVLTEHHPLLGAWSSGSEAVGTIVNNLGPMQLDLLAPFTKIGPAAGTAIGVVIVNVICIVAIAATVRRLAGPVGVIVAMAATSSITWAMGSALLIEPRQHHAMVLPFLAVLVFASAVAAGEAWGLTGLVLAGSLTLQTHLSFALLTPLLVLWALVAFAAWGWHTRRDGDDHCWAAWRSDARRHGLVAGAVALVCWVQPLWDQFFGEHNMTNVLDATGGGDKPGLGDGARLAATIIGIPPFWGRPSFAEFDPGDRLASPLATGVSLTVVAAALVATGWAAARARSRAGVAIVATAGIAVIGAILSSSQVPAGTFGLLSGNYRWLWPIGAFVVTAVVIGGLVLRPQHRAVPPVVAGLFSVACVILVLMNLPTSYQAGDVANSGRRIDVTRELTAQLELVDVEGPVIVDRSASFFGEPYTHAAIAELQSLDIDFTFDVPSEIYRFGDGRRELGDATHRMTFAFGDDARQVPDGTERVAFVAGLDGPGRRELQALNATIVERLVDGTIRVRLDEAAAETGETFPRVTAAVADDIGPDGDAFLSFELSRLERLGFVDAQEQAGADIERWFTLRARAGDTVAIFLTPVE
ncbi:MAG: hypothetical protein M3337_03555 [Actinomycetota bacterium]|nr:hypothetical protein [Actinomycetota bacterium]